MNWDVTPDLVYAVGDIVEYCWPFAHGEVARGTIVAGPYIDYFRPDSGDCYTIRELHGLRVIFNIQVSHIQRKLAGGSESTNV